jgi:hypothetical protein
MVSVYYNKKRRNNTKKQNRMYYFKNVTTKTLNIRAFFLSPSLNWCVLFIYFFLFSFFLFSFYNIINKMGESRTELLAWLNDLLQISYTKVEQAGTGKVFFLLF